MTLAPSINVMTYLLTYLTGLFLLIPLIHLKLDKFWHSQDIVYDFRAQLQGTGSRSEVLCEKFE